MDVSRRGLIRHAMSLGSFASAAARADAPAHLPTVAGRDLNGRDVRLPADLPGPRTLLLIAFAHEQQDDVDTWVVGLGLGQNDIPFLELPVIADLGLLGRTFINTGMRFGVADATARAHVVTIYTDVIAFRAAMSVPSSRPLTAAVVDRAGRVLESRSGRFDPAAGEAIRRALAV